MKKFILLLVLVVVLSLTGCKESDDLGQNHIILPDLSGKTEVEIIEIFSVLDFEVEYQYNETESEEFDNLFIEYLGFNTGDIVSELDEVIVVVYPLFTGERTFVILPDISGLSKDEIQILFDNIDVDIVFFESGEATIYNEFEFNSYGQFLSIGDTFILDLELPIVIYPEYFEEGQYFSILDMEYDGPYLDESFSSIDPVDPRGGYFEVVLYSCVDGDTAKFNYPQFIYDAIPNFSYSTRFLNMDTEETYGDPEEWGKPGSVYTCDLLNSAESIVLQTDPNDDLIDNEDYRRLLAWIWIKLPGEEEYFLLNYMVVIQGLAQVKFEFGSGETISYGEHTYNEWMHIAEDYAILNALGQWGNLLDYYWDYENETPDYSRWD